MVRINSTRSVPVSMTICAGLSAILLCACFAAEHFLPPEPRDFVAWVDAKAAISKAKSEKKPILYDFSADWCGPCNLMIKQVFASKESAKFINKCFVPVRVLDREHEDGGNSIEIERLQKKYHVAAFPTLVVARVGDSDVERTQGYGGKEKTMEFLTKAVMQQTTLLGKNNYIISWKNLDDQLEEWPDSKKPLLILCWNEDNETSRYQYLSNQDLIATIRKNFLPVELSVPVKPDAVKSEKAKALLEVLKIKRAPALVIVPADGSLPHFQIGSTEADDNLAFVRNYLRLANADKKLEL